MDTMYLDTLERQVKNNELFENIFEQVVSILTSFICFQREEEPIVLANYVVSTYFYNAFQFTPYIHINSPDFQCGKSTLLDILYELCYNSMKSANISSAIHRFTDYQKGTLLLDEMDRYDNDERKEMVGILNSGFSKRGGKTHRLVGNSHQTQEFDTYCPKVFCSIGSEAINPTLVDRSIPIALDRATPEQLKETEMFIWTPTLEDRFDAISMQLENLAQEVDEENNPFFDIEDYLTSIAIMKATNPNARAIDITAPLLTIACLGNLEWATESLNAFNVLTSRDTVAMSVPRQLLGLCYEIYQQTTEDKIFTRDLADKINFFEDSQFASWNRGNGINPSQVTKNLKDFVGTSKDIRIGSNNGKGFYWNDFIPAFDKHIPRDVPNQSKVDNE